MILPTPVVLNECAPLDDGSVLMDEDLRNALRAWQVQHDAADGVPVWQMDFAMDNSSVVSRTIMYDTSGDDIVMAIIGEECRNFIGLDKTKGLLKELMPEANVEDVTTRLAQCSNLQRPTYCLKTMSWNEGRDFIKYEVLFLPFVTDNPDECAWFFVPMAFHVDECDEVN